MTTTWNCSKTCAEGIHHRDCFNFRTRTTEEEIAQLRIFMQLHWGPQNVDAHSAGKAHCYLGKLESEGLLDRELGWKTSKFVDACRGVSSGRLTWKDLGDSMRGWF